MKKVLVVFGDGTQKDILIDSALFIKNNFGYEIVPLYIRDIRKDEIMPSTVDGVIVNVGNVSFSKERDALEEEEVKELQKKLTSKNIQGNLNKEFGFPWEIIKEYLKTADMLIFEKGEILSESAITILKDNFKPIILVGEKPLTSLSNIGISSDDGVKINKSVFSFINIFPAVTNLKIMTLLKKLEEHKLLNYLKEHGKNLECQVFDAENAKEDYLQAVNKLDLLIMGNLSKSYFFEKITGRKGLTILEKSKTSVYIG